MKKTLRIGTNRNNPRIWIEGQCLKAQGWTKGTTFDCQFHNGSITYTQTPEGKRRVAGTDKRPIIDTNTGNISNALGSDEYAAIEITPEKITITPGTKPPSKIAGALAAIALAAASIAAPYITQFAPGAQRVLIACEESATVRDEFTKLGHDAVSCDIEGTRNPYGWHITGDVTPYLDHEWDLVIGFPPCTFLTNACAWAFNDPDFTRYPGIGYHQKVQAGTLTGEARRKARQEAVAFAIAILDSCQRAAIENPAGALSSRFRQPDQIIQPWMFGHPESKTTCLWLKNLPPLEATNILTIEDHGYLTPSGIYRWQNQTPNGQNKLPPSKDRAKIRSKTYQGIAQAMAAQWGGRTHRIHHPTTITIPAGFI